MTIIAGCGSGGQTSHTPTTPTAEVPNRRDTGEPDAAANAGSASSEIAPPEQPVELEEPREPGPICSSDGWCWSNPLPQGRHLRAGLTRGDANVVVAGDGGSLLRYDGDHWRALDSGTTSKIQALWSVGRDAPLLLATEAGQLLRVHDEGSIPEKIDVPGRLSGLWGTGANDIFAVGDRGSIRHFDGKIWSRQPCRTAQDLYSVWGASPEAVFAVGRWGVSLHYDGSQWRELETNTKRALTAIWGVNEGEVYTIGRGGVVRQFNGRAWRKLWCPHEERDLFAIWGRGSGDVFFAGDAGMLLHYDGSKCRALAPLDDIDVRALVGVGSGELLAIGLHGQTLRVALEQDERTPLSHGVTAALHDVWVDPEPGGERRLAVGDGGLILEHDGEQWRPLDTGLELDQTLHALWSDGETVIAAGRRGTVIHFDGERWTKVGGNSATIHLDLWGASSTDVYLVGAGGSILHFDGERWEPQRSGVTLSLAAIWGSGPADLFAVGVGGVALHYDGESWSPQESGTNAALFDLWGFGSDVVWAVGAGGTILHFDGTSWQAEDSGTTEDLQALWGSAPNNLWAVGFDGTILHRSDSGWEPHSSGSGSTLHAISGGDHTTVVTVGEAGTILERVCE